MQGLEDVRVVAHLRQFAGGGQAARTRADHGHLEAALVGVGLAARKDGPAPVGHEPLKPPDGYRLALDAADALYLALLFLRADAACSGRQGVIAAKDLGRRRKIPRPVATFGEELRNRAPGPGSRPRTGGSCTPGSVLPPGPPGAPGAPG